MMHPLRLALFMKFQAVVYLNNSHININYVIITKQQAVASIQHIIVESIPLANTQHCAGVFGAAI
jgi:hypothetical protein